MPDALPPFEVPYIREDSAKYGVVSPWVTAPQWNGAVLGARQFDCVWR
ncbi:MAG: hypothetical protein ACI8T1_001834 [Verrucomicrobiales bacterium]|jgi:hypothetical protein